MCRVGNCGGNGSDLQCITKLGIKAAFEIALKVMAEECCVYVSAEWFIQESGWSPVHRHLHLQLCNLADLFLYFYALFRTDPGRVGQDGVGERGRPRAGVKLGSLP